MTAHSTAARRRPPARIDLRKAAGRAPSVTRELLVNAILQRRILQRPYAATMHLLIFWGVTVQVVGTAVNLMQMRLFTPWELTSFPRSQGYFAYELVMDLAGVAILVGVAMAAWRRLVMRPKTLESRWDDYFALGLLALIPIVGFTVEGLRLVAVSPPWAAWSPVGNLVAGAMGRLGVTPGGAVALHDGFVWVHAFLGMALLASIPFTKLRHLVTAPLNIATRSRTRPGTWPLIENLEEAEHLGVGTVGEFTSSQLLSFDACVRCGRCASVCPVSEAGMPYAPHHIVQGLRTAMVDVLVHGAKTHAEDAPILGTTLPAETPWYCTTCGACAQSCPAFVNPLDTIVDLRRYEVMTTGNVPKPMGDTLRNLERQGNPWGMPVEDRADRVRDLGMRVLAPGDSTETLLFMGCAFAFDERNARAAKAFVRVMEANGIDVATLGDAETCCGEQARRMGHEWLFQELARQNLETFSAVRFDRIVTQCPHCFNTLKHEYRQLGAELEVLHYTEYLASLPGGLGLADAVDAKADIVATACPYCLLMFDDAMRSTGVSETMKVMDIAEVLAARLDHRVHTRQPEDMP